MSCLEKIVCAGISLALLALMVVCVLGIMANEKQWEAFKSSHACKVVAHISGDVFNTIGTGPTGQIVIGIGSTPDKTGWLCNDGITYYH